MYRNLIAGFTGGIASPDVLARVDMEKYSTFLKDCKNAVIKPYGGVYKRSGTYFLGYTKDNRSCRLIAFRQPDNDYLLEFTEYNLVIRLLGELVAEIDTPFTKEDVDQLKYIKSAETMFFVCGRLPVMLLKRNDAVWTIEQMEIPIPPFQLIEEGEISLAASAASGEITLTASGDFFTEDMIGESIKLYQRVPPQVLRYNSAGPSTDSLFVGDSWNVITTGTWTGEIYLERSRDTETWEDFIMWTATNNFNANESGVVDKNDGWYFRIRFALTSGSAQVVLSQYLFTNEGVVKITGIMDEREAAASVTRKVIAGSATNEFALSEFSAARGYPKNIEFFQDRMVFAGTDARPNGIWLSKSGDYASFEEAIADGKLTDDSAINTSVIARNDYYIKNLIAGRDLCIFTGEDERIIDGSKTLAPSAINIAIQSSWGSSDKFMPFVAGNRILYVQSNEAFVRDFAYSFEHDGYAGNELTLLIHNFLDGKRIIDYAYSKFPDSVIYFIFDDGSAMCLTYLLEEKIFAWTRFETQGQYMNVETLKENGVDITYFSVLRDGKYTIEVQAQDSFSTEYSDYCMLDAAEVFYDHTGQGIVIERFANKKVWVMTSGDIYNVREQTAGENGEIEITPHPEGAYGKIIVGLLYEFEMVVPELHAVLSGKGSTIDKDRAINSIIVRYYLSFGGYVYVSDKERKVPVFSTRGVGQSILNGDLALELRTGTQAVPLPQESNKTGEIVIGSETPYPLKILSVARDTVL